MKSEQTITIPHQGDFLFRFWGGDQNRAAALCPVPIFREGDNGALLAWFHDSASRHSYMGMLHAHRFVVAAECVDGDDSHFMTYASAVLSYGDQTFRLEVPYGYGFPEDVARFIWAEGNNSCDCNRSVYIARYADSSFREMECGDKIKLVELNTNRRKQEPVPYVADPSLDTPEELMRLIRRKTGA